MGHCYAKAMISAVSLVSGVSRPRAFIGWVSYTEDVPLIRHDVSGWEPIADQAAARAMLIEKPRHPIAPPGRQRVRKLTLVVGR
jgi:hypothetical protein